MHLCTSLFNARKESRLTGMLLSLRRALHFFGVLTVSGQNVGGEGIQFGMQCKLRFRMPASPKDNRVSTLSARTPKDTARQAPRVSSQVTSRHPNELSPARVAQKSEFLSEDLV